MATSQNGYVANDITRTQVYTITGTVRKVRLRKGAPGALLVHFAAWFDKNIETIDNDKIMDDWGYAEREIRGSTTTLSNHASGTAIDLNATQHPLGKRGTFTATEATEIRARLKAYNGCIRWGGDYENRADEMHFEIVRDVAACDAALKKVSAPPATGGATKPSTGGTMALTAADLDAIEQRAYEGGMKANIEYGALLWGTTGTAGLFMRDVRAKLAEIDATVDRIEDDTDDGLAPKA